MRKGIIGDLLGRTLGLLLFCILIALLFNALSSNGIPLIPKIREVQIEESHYKIPVFLTRRQLRQIPAEQIALHPAEPIRLSEAQRLFRDEGALFIDTREQEQYRLGHIPRALSVPLESMAELDRSLGNISKDQTIVTYCDGEECSQSIDLAMRLEEIGYLDVYFFLGGWQEWLAAGYPITTGAQP